MSGKLYLECASGISGDMFTAALLDLGADEEVLRRALNSLKLPGFQIQIGRVSKNGLDACDFSVILDREHENHDHDMEYLHGADGAHRVEQSQEDMHHHDGGHMHEHDAEYTHECDIEHMHEHGTGHMHEHGTGHMHEHDAGHMHTHESGHQHVHRNLQEILQIIKDSEIGEAAKEIAESIFRILAQAESKAHGVSIDEVHFHEVGAVDSIVDIVAAAVCMENLGIKETIIPTLCEGTGHIRCQHGMIPIPVPAVAAIVQAHGLSLHLMNVEGEFVTPTGAAIAAAIRTKDTLPKEFTILRTGIGAGKRSYERPSLLRAMLIQEKECSTDFIYMLESNLDDCTGEALGYVMEKLFDSGARDVYYMPIYMKKNRPAYQMNVICREADVEKLEGIIFAETTTIGIRKQRMERSILDRSTVTKTTSLGEAQVKICSLSGGKRIYPEYDSVVKLSRESGLSWQEVYQLIVRESYDNGQGGKKE